MSHVDHIKKNKERLITRFQILRLIREWFSARGFMEVETPLIVRLPGQEPHLHPISVRVRDERGEEFVGYLHTSPEYTMKKMLAAGFDKIFSLGKVFRDRESFGGIHNPEFTMLEWYRAGADYRALIDDIDDIVNYLVKELKQIRLLPHDFVCQTSQRAHMRELWQKHVGINLDYYLTRATMHKLCEDRGYKPLADEPYEDLFYRIFLNEIEPKFERSRLTIAHHYPLPMAALSRNSSKDTGYAERVEAYFGSMELANGFSELTDSGEQRQRLEAERDTRSTTGKTVFDLDEEFLSALTVMPASAGMALGVDRLAQILTGCQNIDDVLVLPMSKLLSS